MGTVLRMMPAEARFSFATADRIAVVAPHPDDDVLGCGALLAAAADGGIAVAVWYVTDGSQSHPASRRFPPQRVRAIREREALAALARCGIPPSAAAFLRVPDGRTAALSARESAAVCERLVAAFAAFRPTIVLAPWRRDPHPDHRAVARLSRAAVARLPAGAGGAVRPRYVEYPVWLAERGLAWEVPRRSEVRRLAFAFDAASEERKRAAVGAHRSQTSGLIDDDPAAFRLSDAMLARACASPERYFEARRV
ncbi:MAG: PIG-L family deacetylase [Vulcanimicrobiaceae bacterium]